MTRVTGSTKKKVPFWVFDLLLVIVLLAGALLRATGLDWGENQYLHPDERFLVWVGTDITPISNIDPETGEKTWLGFSEYFDTANSPLNPNNRGHGFYVYGTLPMFLTRIVVEWVFGHSGFEQMTQVGRIFSALTDLLIVLLVYLVAARLYSKRVGILAAAFSALVVLQIQQSHFFTMDTFVNLFSFLAFYFAVRIQTGMRPWYEKPRGSNQEFYTFSHESPEENLEPESTESRVPQGIKHFFLHPLFLPSLGFGIAFGMAMASKLNALPVALLLPAAMLLRLATAPKKVRPHYLLDAIWYLIMAGVVSFLVFRVLQPYAFSGPGFFGIQINPAWWAQIQELRSQASPNVDFPPAMQWARRSVFFSAQNLVTWGLGLPLGILSWVGFLWVGWRMIKGEWNKHALIWGWTATYFTWQSLVLNPTMRYQLPIYPTMVIFAAWAVFQLYDYGRRETINDQPTSSTGRKFRILAVITGALVLLLTAVYALGFNQIYNRSITRLEASRWIFQNIPGAINLRLQTDNEVYNQPLPFYYDSAITYETPYTTYFDPKVNGSLSQVYLPHVIDFFGEDVERNLTLSISDSTADENILGTSSLNVDFTDSIDPRGGGYSLVFDQPIILQTGTTYKLALVLDSPEGAIVLEGATLANEGEWDDGIPYRVEGYDPFGGIYPPDINFNMYWEENPAKLERFQRILDQSDYIAITSSRQWGSLPRMPERFPMSTIYYRELLGCPTDRSIEWCYTVAEPGTFEGGLGFDLIKTFTSNPSLGPVSINDQFAEEAFTVYDHPKVFIFQKNDSYNSGEVAGIIGAVDFSRIVRLPPLQYESNPADLMLPVERFIEQVQGGTWSQIFNTDGFLNRFPALSVLVWYVSLSLLGIIVYPIVRLALPGLNDRGYPLARITGLLILSFLVWLAGSSRIPFTRFTISIALLTILVLGALLAYRQRHELRAEWRSRRRYFLIVEGLVLAFFIIDLLIRYGNPDLWHAWKGGEKPMDFAYLNAVLKSTSFPPFDPWFAGGYLNYYYYGFMLVGVLVKWLGIVPSIAYNLIIPTLFSLIAIGAFSVAWNLVCATLPRKVPVDIDSMTTMSKYTTLPYVTGVTGALGMAVLGNLGTIKMIVLGYQRLAAPGGVLEGAGFFPRLVWTFQGFIESATGASLPYSLGDWYWLPSRIIPAPGEIEPITEFPIFTVLYADPHAHLFALPIALLVISFALSVVLARGRWQGTSGVIIGLLLGGLAIGALRPTNTWDFYPYLVLSAIALGYAIYRYYTPSQKLLDKLPALQKLPTGVLKAITAAGGVMMLVGLSFLLYQPYAHWYALGYSKIELWQGTRTPLHAYLLHWGLFLFIIISWMVWESIDWMANTRVSALRKLEPYREIIWFAIALLVFATIALGIKLPELNDLPFGNGINVAWLALPLAAWAAVLLIRPGQPDAKRFVLFMIGTGLVLTLMVEVIVLRGDVARMNTVFKFYLQVWTLLSVSAAAAFGWSLKNLSRWSTGWRTVWQVVLIILVAGTALYPLMAGRAKIQDRMAADAPHTLDGMAYMQYATYTDSWGTMDLRQDHDAIRWLQENVSGSPVIVEANLRNLYRWGSRISIYTGLPAVVGWEWHQQQQRAILPGSWITERIFEVDEFYTTIDTQRASDFLDKYDVQYIILGQQERGQYKGPGLDKFDEQNGIIWIEVYRDGDTVIYKVL